MLDYNIEYIPETEFELKTQWIANFQANWTINVDQNYII